MTDQKELKFYKNTAPVPGAENCLCSWCGEKITAEQDDDIVSLWKERDPNQMAIVHTKCFLELREHKFTSVKYGK